MSYKTIRDLSVNNKAVLVRVDYNVPVENGAVGDSLRIEASFETIRYLLARDCRIILISHMGEPPSGPDPKLSLAPVATKASELLGQSVTFVPNCVGEEVEMAVHNLQPKEILLLENLRFNSGETANDEVFAQTLAGYADVYVDDAFAVIHRAHASLVGVPKFLPGGIGFLVEREIKTITEALDNPKRPLLAVIGGSKISSKINVLNHLLPKVDNLMIGGAMANTFLAALGTPVGKSLYESDQKQVAQNILETAGARGVQVLLPTDIVVSTAVDGSAPARSMEVTGVAADDIIADVGPHTVDAALDLIGGGTVIWNGPLGITEVKEFCGGSQRLAEGIIASGAYSLIGGGDTADFIDGAGLHEEFSFVSTGGGASLELMAGSKLPGLVALEA